MVRHARQPVAREVRGGGGAGHAANAPRADVWGQRCEPRAGLRDSWRT